MTKTKLILGAVTIVGLGLASFWIYGKCENRNAENVLQTAKIVVGDIHKDLMKSDLYRALSPEERAEHIWVNYSEVITKGISECVFEQCRVNEILAVLQTKIIELCTTE